MASYYDQSYGPIVLGAFYPLMGDHTMTKTIVCGHAPWTVLYMI